MGKHRLRSGSIPSKDGAGSDVTGVSTGLEQANTGKNRNRLVLVDDVNLKELDEKRSLWEYLKATYHRRHFIRADARSRSLQAGSNMYLGRAWLVLQPIFDVSVYAIIFGLILHVSRGIENFVGYLVIGVVFFKFVSRGISSGSGLIQASRGMISSFQFPCLSVVLARVLRQFYDNLIPTLVGLVIAFSFQIPNYPTWTILALIPLYLLVHLFILGLVLIVARLTAFIPDLKSLISLFNRALFFTSGIFFTLERFDGHPVLGAIMKANPVYQFLTAAREVTIYQSIPSYGTLISLCAWTFGLLIFGLWFFWRAEERYATVK